MLKKYITFYLNIMKTFLFYSKCVSTMVNSLEPINKDSILYITDVDKCISQHILCDISDLI